MYNPITRMEEEIIDKDFTQSYWLAVQFVLYNEKQTKPDLYRGVPQISQGIKVFRSCNTSWKKKLRITDSF